MGRDSEPPTRTRTKVGADSSRDAKGARCPGREGGEWVGAAGWAAGGRCGVGGRQGEQRGAPTAYWAPHT